MERTTAGWRAPPAPASPGAAAGRPAPAPARHSLGPAWRYLRPLAAARHCARPWWSSPLLVVRRARCPGRAGTWGDVTQRFTYPADRLRSLMLWRTRRAAIPTAGGPARRGDLAQGSAAVSYTHLRAHETVLDLVCRLL